jgi:pimeloyl-ACP methyl ester carboxylesterase
LRANRRELCKFIWRSWSPNWRFDDATFERTAASFDNPDFVEVVIHSYRHRFGYVAGDPSLEPIEQRLAARPRITVPTIVLHGDGSGLSSPASSVKHAPLFTGPYQHRLIPLPATTCPRKPPTLLRDAVLELVQATA